jgi:hypothetical protein
VSAISNINAAQNRLPRRNCCNMADGIFLFQITGAYGCTCYSQTASVAVGVNVAPVMISVMLELLDRYVSDRCHHQEH